MQNQACLISLLVCMETDGVLESCYKLSKEQRIEFFNTIIAVKQFTFEDMGALKRAVLNLQKSNTDLSENLIASRAKTLGAEQTLTFDKKARAAGMQLLSV